MASGVTDNPASQADMAAMETLPPSEIQRAALRDLVKLSADSAASEQQIEEWFHTSVTKSREEFERVSEHLKERQDGERQEIEKQYGDAVRQLHEQFQAAVSAVREADRSARTRLTHEKGSIDHQVKQKYAQATWLADSVFEAAHIRTEDSYRTGLEANAEHLEQAESLESQAQHLLYTLGYSLPESEPNPTFVAPEEAAGIFDASRASTEELLRRIASLRLPRLLVGVMPFMLGLLLCAAAGVLTQVALHTREPQFKELGIVVGATAALCIVLGFWLSRKAGAQVSQLTGALRASIDQVKQAAVAEKDHLKETRRRQLTEAQEKREQEVKAAKEQFGPILEKAAADFNSAIADVEGEKNARLPKLDDKKLKAQAEADAWRDNALREFDARSAEERAHLQDKLEAHLQKLEAQRQSDDQSLARSWCEGLKALEESVARSSGPQGRILLEWREDLWQSWVPPQQFPEAVRFGELQVDLKQITSEYPRRLNLPQTFSMPALLSFPRHASLMLHADGPGRNAAMQTLQTVMLRLLTSVPPGRVRFTIIDPIGLGQNFAGFMHLADYDEALVGTRIWTEPEHIQQRLADLTEHMETVIQKYLRNEFETIDEYNAQAGELAEPYRFVVLADVPAALTDESLQRLSSIATTGARCGVYMLIARDTRQTVSNKAVLDNLMAHSVNLIREGGRFIWKDEIFRKFPLVLDSPPTEEFLTQILHRVGKAARDAKRVEVPFSTIAPTDDKIWSGSTSNEVSVPVGRMGATRLQSVRLGRGVAQHALIAGKTGSGKSTLLHVLVTNLSLWYSPDEVEFYLVDFKKGVEFKAYATHQLPHARAIAVESDREFGLSVLQRVDAELGRRGELFRQAGVQDLASYRQYMRDRLASVRSDRQDAGPTTMPRTLLIIDEFQEFFSEDDRIAQDAGLLLDRLVRQGRAFGIHVLLGSQTIGGSSGLARSTLGQMAVRIALQTSEADSQMILGDNNIAARLLSRPGEAIYNDAGGLVEANSPFQISWLSDDERERQLERARKKLDGQSLAHAPAIVFEGNVPADIRQNPALAKAIEQYPPAAIPDAPRVWLGDPVAIKAPTQIVLRRQSGANALIIGQQEEAALALLASGIAALAAQFPRGGLKMVVLDGTPADSPLISSFEKLRSELPADITLVEYRSVPVVINELAEELQRRQESSDSKPPAIVIFIHGMQRYRALRKQEDSFSFSSSGESTPQPDRQLAAILRDGPPVGIHVLASIDTVASLERTFDRGSIREFDNRILFQMSANDSSTLIDSPLANKLGVNRALAYSEEQGVVEKFRPYAFPPQDWLLIVKSGLQC